MIPVMDILLDANDWTADYDGLQCLESDKPYITAAGTCFQPTHN